jgi:DNA-binding response OmpR family regulator
MLRFGGVELNRMEHTVSHLGVRVELTAKEFALLEFLMLRRGGSCSRAELLTEVWHSTPEAGTNVVDVYITYLRKKLAAAHPEDGVWTSVIETVRGMGYRMRDRRGLPSMETGSAERQRQTAPERAYQA